MTNLLAKEKKLHEQLAAAATDPNRLMELGRELKSVEAERDTVETDWMAAAELVE